MPIRDEFEYYVKMFRRYFSLKIVQCYSELPLLLAWSNSKIRELFIVTKTTVCTCNSDFTEY